MRQSTVRLLTSLIASHKASQKPAHQSKARHQAHEPLCTCAGLAPLLSTPSCCLHSAAIRCGRQLPLCTALQLGGERGAATEVRGCISVLIHSPCSPYGAAPTRTPHQLHNMCTSAKPLCLRGALAACRYRHRRCQAVRQPNVATGAHGVYKYTAGSDEPEAAIWPGSDVSDWLVGEVRMCFIGVVPNFTIGGCGDDPDSAVHPCPQKPAIRQDCVWNGWVGGLPDASGGRGAADSML